MQRLLPNVFLLQSKLVAINHQKAELTDSCEVRPLQYQLQNFVLAALANRKVREPN
jgi:hypothetical protein